MRTLSLMIMVLIAGVPIRAQTATVGDLTRGILVMENYWHREYPSLVSDFSFGAINPGCGDESPDQHSYHLRDRKEAEPYSERCLAAPMPSRRSGSENYIYRVKIRNNGNKLIKGLAWDYVFLDPETRMELGRHSFFSETRLSPGNTKSLIAASPSPPSRVIPARMLHENRRSETYAERVEIRSVYVDRSNANPRK